MKNTVNLLIGRLGCDPELRYTHNKTAVCTLSIAERRRTADEQNQWQSLVIWHDLTVWGQLAERAASILRKGTLGSFHFRIDYRKCSLMDKGGTVVETRTPTFTLQAFEPLADFGIVSGETASPGGPGRAGAR